MRDYETPMMIVVEESAEGIYMASGKSADEDISEDVSGLCNSASMKGIFRPANPNGLTYLNKFGCQTCPKGNHNGCKLKTTGYVPDTNGKNMPHWERQGHQPDELFKG